jgi:UDP-N-acetylmuramoyl-tripeptide--D-alanyl-D-alanine ligase
MNLEQLYEIFLQHPVITTDSRKITPGCIFAALKGPNFNGNFYAKTALDAGASYAITDETIDADRRLIKVGDVLSALQQLATLHRKKLAVPVLAITGSNGKTTTKELIAHVLKQKYTIAFTQGNLNNHIGVPLTLLSFSKDTEIGIVEMGANHPGEIDFLCRIAQPDYGIITNIGKAHLEGFGSFEGVIQTKSEMYRYLENNNGTIFINGDDTLLQKAASPDLNKLTYGTSDRNWLHGENIVSPPFLNLRVWFPSGVLYINTKLIGDYNLENVLAAMAIGKHFGIDPLQIKKGIESYIPANNRSQLVRTETNQIIMDAYNANPTSMKASINNFLSLGESHKVLILGDMLELGIYSSSEHQNIVDMVSSFPNIKIILVGKEFSNTSYPGHFKVFENTIDAKSYLSEYRISNSYILIKGSRGIGLENVLDVLY